MSANGSGITGKDMAAILIAIIAVTAVLVVWGGPDQENHDGHDDLQGTKITYETSGTYQQGLFTTYTSTGTQSMTYLYYSEEKGTWFINYYAETTYDYGNGRTSTRVDDVNQWGLNSETEIRHLGTETIETKYYGTKTCEVRIFTNPNGSWEKQWSVGDEVYYIHAEYVSADPFNLYSYAIDFHLMNVEQMPVSLTQKVTLYPDVGIIVEGNGTYKMGEFVTVKASGPNFYGWMDENYNIVSTSNLYTFQLGGADVTLTAVARGSLDERYESLTPQVLDSGEDLVSAMWTITGPDGSIDIIEGATPTYTFDSAGYYRISIDGTLAGGEEYHGYRFLLVNGYTHFEYDFVYGRTTYTLELDIAYSDYLDYRGKYYVDERRESRDFDNKRTKDFVVVDRYILEMADFFKSLKAQRGWTDVQTADCILAFTQYIEYQTDELSKGHSEYWRLPVETLYDRCGDCEDTSILCAAIYKAMGYKSAIIIMTGHIAVGLSLDGLTGAISEKPFQDGYYYGETTNPRYSIGKVPNDIVYLYLVPIAPYKG
jgi:hypothetical protein